MKSDYPNRHQLEQLIRSTKTAFTPPIGLLKQVKAAIAAAPQPAPAHSAVVRRPWMPIYACAAAVMLALGAGLLMRQFGATDPGRGNGTSTQTPLVGAAGFTKPIEPTKTEPTLAVISVRQPATDDSGHAIKLGDRLAAGCKITTGDKGRISLITRRGSELTLNSNSAFALATNGKDAILSQGQLYCRNREHELGAIDTAAGTIELLGTTVSTTVKDKQTVAVTVVEGKVRLENAHGQAVVDSGKQSVLIAQRAPESGNAVDTIAETAWYDGRRILSDYGEIAYAVSRGDKNITEIWVMKADGSGKRRVKSYVGWPAEPLGPWLRGQQVLLVEPAGLIWAYPDFETQRADTHRGEQMIQPFLTWWLLDTATEQDVSIAIPSEYQPFRMTMSPDATMIAFDGTQRTAPKNWEQGTWLYDLRTGAITRLLDERADAPPAWSPDGRRLAVAAGNVWSGDYRLRLVVIDVETRAVNDLKVAGTDPCFSPDGTTLTYVAGITGQHTSRDQGKIFVLNLEAGAQPRQISPGAEGWGSSLPQWSPGGTRVLYTVLDRESGRRDDVLKVAAADGSGSVEAYRGRVGAAAWNRSQETLYVDDLEKGMLLVAADGSGVIAHLGGNEGDSPLSPAEEADFQSVQTTLQQAVFEHAMGKRYAYYGQPIESKTAHQKSAQLLAEMPWRCPNLGLSLSNAMIYADAEKALADQPAAQMVLDTCKQRLSHAAYLVAAYYKVNGKLAPDLATVETWAKALPLTTMNDVIRLDRDDISVVFRCPDGGPFTYMPPASGTEPKEGDVMLTCPGHPDIRATWTKTGAGEGWGADTPSGWRITDSPE